MFKVGDKVKICKTSRWKVRIKETIGTIRRLDSKSVEVKWDTCKCVVCGIDNPCIYPVNIRQHKLSDIEPTVKINQQLLFSFME